MPVRTAIVRTAGYDPEFVKFWNAWIGKHEVIKERRIKGTRLFTLRGEFYVAFIVDGPCGVPCYQERCLIFDRRTGRQVGEFITKELLPAVGREDPGADDLWRERQVNWKKGEVIDPLDKKTMPMTLDRPEGFYPDGRLPTPED